MDWIDTLNRKLGEWCAWLFLVAVAITAYEVVMRYVLNLPTTWGFELTVLLCAIGYLAGGPYATEKKAHIAITVLRDAAPPVVRWWLDLLAILTGLVAMIGFGWAGWRAGWRAIMIGERTGSAWNSPSPAIIKPLLVVAALLVLLQLIAHLVRHLRQRPV